MAGLDLSGLVPIVEDLLLQDVVRIALPASGEPELDPATGLYTHPVGDIVYEGKGAVQSAYTADVTASTPNTNLPWVAETRSRYRMFTPLSVPIAEKDTIVTVVQVHAGGDVTLLGRQWRVQDPSIGGTLGVVRITMLDQIAGQVA
ncbi:DUF6093 family protein [Streptomyces sp. NPDC059524]|uniref:DUF6093 family protein n=1 Tax=Streptomyces sp. NPDC059524 TaxID=3346856 RepID=UPI0036B9D448